MPRESVETAAPQASSGSALGIRISDTWICGLIFLTVLGSYLPALSGGMLWDDAGHVTRADLRSLEGLGRIWFEFGATQQYYPFLHSAFWLEHHLWGDATLGYHLVNILLHAGAACLFGLLLKRLAMPGGWLAAFLFALHPVCVESVAWISEQKNTLSLLLYLGAALAYLRFDERRRRADYALACGLFALALLTKTVTATLPAALLVVFWWKRGRLSLRRDLLPLLPWFALGILSGLVTAYFESVLIGAQGSDFNLSLLQRGLLAGRVVWFYLAKLFWPSDLMFIYPRWDIDATQAWQWLFPAMTLGTLGFLLWWRVRSRAPLAAALLFGGALVPVLGFVNVFPFVFSYVADHFQYLASLPIFALTGAGLSVTFGKMPRWAAPATTLSLLGLLASLSWAQCGLYRDLFTLYEGTLETNPTCWMAHNNLGIALSSAGRIDEALPHFEAAIRLKPDYAPAENNLGYNLMQVDRVTEAVPHFERALQLQKAYAAAHCNLGLALARLNRTAEALPHFAEAVRIDPNHAEAELNWGIALMLSGRFPEAVPHFDRSLKLNPGSVDAHTMVGRAYAGQGQFTVAVTHFREALRLAPDYAEAHQALAEALHQLGNEQEAESHLREARRLQMER